MRVAPGAQLGKWTVLEKSRERHRALCRCECGTERWVNLSNLYSGASQSCGCLNAEKTGDRFRKHRTGYGDYRYRLWRSIKKRCYATTYVDFPHYGGRGIQMHEPWVNDFPAFSAWIDEALGERPEGHTLDRINNEGNYEPGNIRWATRSEQAFNRRNRWRNRSS